MINHESPCDAVKTSAREIATIQAEIEHIKNPSSVERHLQSFLLLIITGLSVWGLNSITDHGELLADLGANVKNNTVQIAALEVKTNDRWRRTDAIAKNTDLERQISEVRDSQKIENSEIRGHMLKMKEDIGKINGRLVALVTGD